MLEKTTWIERVKRTAELHSRRCSIDSDWTITKTADVLHRSYGSVNQDLQLAVALRIYPKLETIPQYTKAILFVRARRLDLKRQGL